MTSASREKQNVERTGSCVKDVLPHCYLPRAQSWDVGSNVERFQLSRPKCYQESAWVRWDRHHKQTRSLSMRGSRFHHIAVFEASQVCKESTISEE